MFNPIDLDDEEEEEEEVNAVNADNLRYGWFSNKSFSSLSLRNTTTRQTKNCFHCGGVNTTLWR